MRDPNRFPNSEINDLVGLLKHLVDDQVIPIEVDLNRGLTQMALGAVVEGGVYHPKLLLPKGYLDSLRENPIEEIPVLAFTASQARDFYTRGPATSEAEYSQTLDRALAAGAESLLTLERMASNEGIALTFNRFQMQTLSKFPSGISSLSAGLWYPTPSYAAPRFGNPPPNPDRN